MPYDKKQIEELKEYSLSDGDFRDILETDTNVLTYPQLHNYRHIDEIFDPLGRAILLYLTEGKNIGHWVSLIKRGNTIEFYDPYGNPADTQQRTLGLTPEQDRELNGGQKILTEMVEDAGYTLVSNRMKAQQDAPNVNTCGRHAVLRTMMYHLPMRQYNRWLASGKGNGINLDDIVSAITDKLMR